MIQPIYVYGSAVLREVAQEADLSDKEGLATLVRDLKDTLAHADGCGLAAFALAAAAAALPLPR